MTTNKQLKRLYKFYNRRWFKNKLPDVVVRFGNPGSGALGVTTFIGGEPAYITISKAVKNGQYLYRMVLLHECVHVSLPISVTHGPKFQSRMRTLAKRRAFDGIW
jgi:predicted metal-dependent hydrolase